MKNILIPSERSYLLKILEKIKLVIVQIQWKTINNYGQNILRLFDALPNFLFTTSEVKRDY